MRRGVVRRLLQIEAVEPRRFIGLASRDPLPGCGTQFFRPSRAAGTVCDRGDHRRDDGGDAEQDEEAFQET